MRDSVNISRVSLLHPQLREEVVDGINQAEALLGDKAKIRIVQGLRTFEEQNELYAIGRTTPGHKVTNAIGGTSFHNYGLAIDFAIIYHRDDKDVLSWDVKTDDNKDGSIDWQEVVGVFKKKGWKWGGDWHSIKDNPHLQKTFGNSIETLLSKYKANKFIPGTKYIDVN